jgi:hypothetical protein
MSLARLRQGQGCVISVEAVAGCGWQEDTSPRSKVRGRHVKEMELPPIPAISFPTTPDPRWHVLRFVGKSRKVKLLIHNATLHSHGPANQPASNRFTRRYCRVQAALPRSLLRLALDEQQFTSLAIVKQSASIVSHRGISVPCSLWGSQPQIELNAVVRLR